MSFIVTVPVEFVCAPYYVYEALTNLASYPKWNAGMTMISSRDSMRVGLEYQTKVQIIPGQVNVSHIRVVRLVPGELIELENNSGAISYHATFELAEKGPKLTMVTCKLQFEFRNFILQTVRAAIETMAEERIRRDLETLRRLIGAEGARKDLPGQE